MEGMRIPFEGLQNTRDLGGYQTSDGRTIAAGQYRNFLSILAYADPGKGAILWHCSAGKDRAGMATAFLLLSLGVPIDTVVKDFLKTNEYLKEETRRKVQRIRELGGSEETAASAAVLSQVKREDIETAFLAVKETYGSLEVYLKEKLGLAGNMKKRLEERYLCGAI